MSGVNSTDSNSSNSPGTNQTPSGENESSPRTKSNDERLAELDRILDEYESRLGIPVLTGEDAVTVEARRILSIAPQNLRKMSALDTAEAAFVMGQYAHRLQQAINREQARVTWATQSILKIIGNKVKDYRGVSFEERRLQAVRDNDSAIRLEEIRVKAQLRIDRVSFLSGKANDLAKTLLSLKNAKQGVRD